MPLMRRRGGLLRTAAVVGTAIGRCRQRAASPAAEVRRSGPGAVRPAAGRRGAHAPAPQYVEAAPAEPDVSDELTKLAQLHTQGILTDEEFAAKKAQILGI